MKKIKVAIIERIHDQVLVVVRSIKTCDSCLANQIEVINIGRIMTLYVNDDHYSRLGLSEIKLGGIYLIPANYRSGNLYARNYGETEYKLINNSSIFNELRINIPDECARYLIFSTDDIIFTPINADLLNEITNESFIIFQCDLHEEFEEIRYGNSSALHKKLLYFEVDILSHQGYKRDYRCDIIRNILDMEDFYNEN